ncbi:MAG: transglutaminase domain-containing protein [Flavobacteriales bacterium]
MYNRSIDTLVSYLMIPATNQREKARLIYSWLAYTIRYDDRAYNTRKTSDFSSALVLKNKKGVCLGYAMLFEAMGTEAGLNVRTVIGYAKPMKRGKKMKNPDHAWNAVEVDGRWILCDATWGSSTATPRGNGKIKTKKEFSGFWFDTPPDVFVLTHLPDMERWQLLSHPVTKDQFENFPVIGPEFFTAGFSTDSIMDKMMMIKKFKVVQVYPTKGAWKVRGAPEIGVLSSDTEYQFDILSSDYDTAVVIEGSESKFFKAENNTIRINLKPQKKNTIVLINSKNPRRGEAILVYEVAKH